MSKGSGLGAAPAISNREEGIRSSYQLGRVGSLLIVLLLVLLTATPPTAHGQKLETLFADTPGRYPYAGLVQGSDGNFYGTTSSGGASGYGTVFRVTSAGDLSTLVSFNFINGSTPRAGLVEGSDGNLYGTTLSGGASGYGTVFKVTPAGDLITLVSFDSTNGSNPRAGLVKGSDGNFYGTTYTGGVQNNRGTVFRITPAGVLTTLASFDSTSGGSPNGKLVEGSDGNFYGTTLLGGPRGYGTVFRMKPSGELTTLVSFSSTNGSDFEAGLVEGSDGSFYGTTSSGKADNYYGTAFKVTPSGVLTTLVSFKSSYGPSPYSALVEGLDGNFYGTTIGGGSIGHSTVFRMTPSGVLTTLFTFSRTNGDAPYSGLVEGSDGAFYGTTSSGGASHYGTVFKVTPRGELTTIASFTFRSGTTPKGGLVEGSDGTFYGTTLLGGASGRGTIFKVTPKGEFTTLVSFDSLNGRYPHAGLVEGSDGSFYGTTSSGGASSSGTVFKVTPEGELTTLVSFDSTNGSSPYARLVEGSDGSFYGTTLSGGARGRGTIFKVTPKGELTTLVSFNATNGSNPYAELVEGSDGSFYGTTQSGGARDYGTVFKVTPSGGLTTLVSFDFTNGSSPFTGLVEGSDGSFYGTTSSGGAGSSGTIFKVTPEGEHTTLVSFDFTIGFKPYSGLVKGNDGDFYGTTQSGGVRGRCMLFKVTPTGALTILSSFNGSTASYPLGTPTFGSDGNLYGTADSMVIWRMSGPIGPVVTTNPPTSSGARGVTLSGFVNANARDSTATSVAFDYGLTPVYGSSIAASPALITGSKTTFVSATLWGLAPHTTYFYRITATNSEGTTSTAESSFTTANNPPVATDDTFKLSWNVFGDMTLDVLENDNDADGDPLIIRSITQGAFGTVNIYGRNLAYTPTPGFMGRDTFSYTVSDGFATTTARVELRATELVSRVLFSKGSEVPSTGTEQSEIANGARFKRFGVPSINSAGGTTFTASYLTESGVSEHAVFVLDPKTSISKLAARRGQTAPGTAGALFSSFKDPLLNESGDVAFLATLSGGDTTEQNRKGIWISPSSATGSVGAQLVARTGAQPPGAPAGARWNRFTSIALSTTSGADPDSEGSSWALGVIGLMTEGAGGVDRTNNKGLWIATPGKTVLALREDQTLQIGEAQKRISSFTALKALPNAPGQGSGVSKTGAVAVQAIFTDGSQSLLRVSREGLLSDNIIIEELALPGDPVADSGEALARSGLPSQSESGVVTAWIGTLRGKGSPAVVFERNQSDPEYIKVLAREGDAATEITGATFSAFRSVAVNDLGSVLILGRVTGRGISKANDEALWWKSSGSESSLQLVAREGAQLPGVLANARWSSFTSLALPEGQYGPIFTARLTAAADVTAGLRGISSANDQGLWAVASTGELRLIVREGEKVVVAGSDTPKTIERFTVLSAVPGSPTQRRSFDDQGRIVYRAVFTDGSQAVVKVQVP